jgi:hypothetical protein
MNLNRGCGCLVVVLGLLALLLAIMAMLNFVGARAASPLNALLHFVVLGSSAVLCFILGFPAVRRRRVSQADSVDTEGTPGGDEDTYDETGGDEGTDDEAES